jgi:hypothetical protein
VLDSGCTNHMTVEKSMFSSYSPTTNSNENIIFGDNSKGEVIGLGKVAITLEHSITNVLHIDSSKYHLFSVSQLCEMGYNCLFTDKGVKISKREDSSIVFMGLKLWSESGRSSPRAQHETWSMNPRALVGWSKAQLKVLCLVLVISDNA